MKNLKRALSLVLSTAMLLGMMVVSTGAAHSDVKAEHNEEAIAVVTAAGIMGAGDTFNPDGEITRGEMAVIMTNMLDLDVKDYAGASNFTDAGWAADYIDACYANGIMAGVSATEFGTSVKVTTAQAALMMLKALGYYEAAPLNDWMLDTIKTASKIDLLDGINAKASGVMTRNEVAQLVLNALESNTVEETSVGSNTSIKGEGFEITVDSSYTRDDKLATKYDYDGESDYEQLIEKLFGEDFTKATDGETKLGLPAVVWTDNTGKKAEEIIAVADEADAVVIASKEISALDLYLDKVDEDFEDEMNEATACAGDVVYYYENKDDSIDAYVLCYELVQIDEIDEDLKKAEIADGHKFEVKLDDGSKYYDDEFAGFDYEEDDYVLVVIKDDEIVASELAETIEGKVKSVKGGKYNIDGTAYENLSDTTLAVKDEITAVLNKAGQIVLVTDKNAATKSADFAYIYKIVENEGTKNDDGVALDETYTAYVVLADGSKAKYVIEEDSYSADLEGAVVPYSINKDGEIEVESSDYTVSTVKEASLSSDSKYVKVGSSKIYANSKTEFVFASWNDKLTKLTATTATGIKNVDIKEATLSVIYDADDKDAILVFVMAKDEGVESDAKYAVLLDDEYEYTVDEDDNEYFTYAVYADGDETELVFEDEIKVAEGEIFAYIIDGDYAVVSANEYELTDGTVTYEGEDFIEIDGVEYTVADDVEIYTITEVIDEDGETEGFEVDDGGKIKKDAELSFYANSDDEITLVFVHEIDD